MSLAFRAGLFNIGAQGQLVLGAIFAGYVGFAMDLPPGLHLVVAILAACLGGALWGAIAGVLCLLAAIAILAIREPRPITLEQVPA